MIYNTSQKNKAILDQIDQEIGKATYSFLGKRFFGVFSSKMIIVETSKDLSSLLIKEFQPAQGIIEMRPNGILIHIKRELNERAWPIPFHKLSIEVNKDLKISTPNNYIIFHKGYENNSRFIDNLKAVINK